MRCVSENKKIVWHVSPKSSSSMAEISEVCSLRVKLIPDENTFTFKNVFGVECDTQTVYNSIAKPIVLSVLNGMSGAICAYGHTAFIW